MLSIWISMWKLKVATRSDPETQKEVKRYNHCALFRIYSRTDPDFFSSRCTLQYGKQIRAHPLKIGQDYFEAASFIFRHFQYPGGAFYGSGKWYFYPRATNWGGSGECSASKYEIVGKFKILREKNEHAAALILRQIKWGYLKKLHWLLTIS